MKKQSKTLSNLAVVAAAAVSFAVCFGMMINFTIKKEAYEAKVAEQKSIISSLNEELSANHSKIVKANGQIDKLNSRLAQSEEKLQAVKLEYDKIYNREKMKIAYLTFDDGPSANTAKILDILKKNNVKATFFVTAQGKGEKDYEARMKRIVAEGHTIALHTYSHDYDKVYASVDSYFNDLQKIHDLVKKITGVDTRVIRFPGGSSNTISENYSKGIMTKLTKMVEEKGYAYFDWNCDSTDAEADGRAASKLVANTIGSAGRQKHICVLMHDTQAKSTTADALPEIIKKLKAKGYAFDKLTVDTPTTNFHHSVNN